jgi:hypothetical protein
VPKVITKLPEGKDPCICICFEKIWDAQKTNEDLILRYSAEAYFIRLIPVDKNLNLLLIGKDQERLFKDLEYDYHNFLWWHGYTKGCQKLSFCHVVKDYDKIQLVKTFTDSKPFVLKVKAYVLASEEIPDMLY